MRRVALLLSLALALVSCGGEEQAKTDTPAQRGREIAMSMACLSCHSVDGSDGVAPTWKRLYMSKVELTTGDAVTADEEYLRRSMLEPSSQTVKGYQEGLMETVIKPHSLTHEEVRALIAYIRSLK